MLKEFCHFRIKLIFRSVGPVLIKGMSAFKYILGDNQVSKFLIDLCFQRLAGTSYFIFIRRSKLKN